jgi:hypothetical protein
LILFLDTSALVKLYIAEPGSERMRAAVSRGEPLAVSDLAFAMRRTVAVRVAWVLLLVLCLACGGGSSSSPTEPARRDSLVLLSVEPAQGSTVRLDEPLEVRARFRYTFADAASGRISVFAIPVPFDLPVLAFPLQFSVQGTEGEATTTLDILRLDPSLPPPSSVVARFTLFPEGQTTSSTTVEVRYQVER